MSEAERAIGAAIRGQRTRLGLKQADLAERIATSQATISAMELAQRPLLVDDVLAVCRALGITLRDLTQGLSDDDVRLLGF